MKNRTLKSIFLDPPSGSAELDRMIDALDPTRLATELTDLVRRGILEIRDYTLFLDVFTRLADHLDGEAMLDVVLDRELDMTARRFAFAAASVLGADRLEARLSHLPLEEKQELSILHFIALMENIQRDLEAGEDLVEVLLSFGEEDRLDVLPILRHARSEAGIPAVMAYDAALREPALAGCHPAMIEAIVEEGGEAATVLLEDLSRSGGGAVDGALVRRAQMRTRTAAIDPSATPREVEGRAYLGACDGQGAFIVFARVEVGKRKTTANLVIRAAGEIRDGFVVPGQDVRDFDGMLETAGIESGFEFVEIPLAEASRIVRSALDRTRRMGVELTSEMKASVGLISSTDPAPEPDMEPSPLKGEKLMRSFERLMEDEIFHTWFFDDGDLGFVGGLPSPFDPERHVMELMAAAGGSPLKDRLAAMTAYMGDYYRLAGDVEASRLMEAAALEVERDFKSSAAGKLVMGRTLAAALEREIGGGEEAPARGQPGDQEADPGTLPGKDPQAEGAAHDLAGLHRGGPRGDRRGGPGSSGGAQAAGRRARVHGVRGGQGLRAVSAGPGGGEDRGPAEPHDQGGGQGRRYRGRRGPAGDGGGVARPDVLQERHLRRVSGRVLASSSRRDG